MKIRVSEDEMRDGTLGACLACGEIAYSVEPDACNYQCECCGKRQVFGLEELLIMGMLEIE